MWVKSLDISNLRNIVSARIDPDPGLNCFTGDNGAGKTSILEALAVLSKGRSFRSGQVSSLIGPEMAHFQIISKIEGSSGSRHQLGMQRGTDQWTARHNGENVSQLSDLTELVPYVLLEPRSHTLVSGPPDGRRKYLDWGVFHVEHSYLPLWRRYSRTLKQRNAALRQSNQSVVESLDPQLVALGEKVHLAREQHTSTLSALLETTLPVFNETLADVELIYRKGWSGESLQDAINSSFQRDMDRGATSPGPHKADLVLTISGSPAKDRLSGGEQKALTAAMILAQAQMIAETGNPPLLMLDDLSSELDDEHLIGVLRAGLALGVQVWLTGTSLKPSILNSSEVSEAGLAMFHVEHGEVSRVKA